MKYLWKYLDSKPWRAETKYSAAVFIVGIIYALAGLAVWLVIRNWALSSTDWMVCFTGYPIVVSWYIVFLYSCNHEFS